MSLSFSDGWVEPVQFEDWPLQGAPHFATSRAYEIFLRELRRYTLEEVGGRSFLIAGHRGAGKTALVAQAIDALYSERIRECVQPDVNSLSRRGRLQRPLIVKLAAKSLISAPPALTPVLVEVEDDGEEEGKTGKRAEKKESTPTSSTATSNDPVAGALVHLTIALYRALAQEVAKGFAIHAATGPTAGRSDRHELAAQLLLDLDDAPEPALLRRKWDQLGRLAGGVLWPRSAAATLVEAEIEDQGLREIVAVATAAQAFQVVSGNVTYKTTSSDAATRDDEAKSTLDIKDLVARLGAVFAGTAAGSVTVAAGHGALLAVGLGLLVWLGSSFALSQTTTRKLHRTRTRDYTFLRDRSIQTLDRELPQVIERIRDAGLAPIFVLDELDKLPDVSATIGALINRLKHIVSDFGFFCFLTNRDYYDALERLIADQAYPSEHTYFSDRLLILARPPDLFRYVVQLLVSDATGEDENLPRATFALMAIYRSRLNFTDLTRELNRHARSDRGLTLTAQALRERRDLRLEAAIQLASDEALRTEPIATRFAQDEAFAQLAVDALNYVSRRWEENFMLAVDCSDAVLEAELKSRILGKSKPTALVPAPVTTPAPPSTPTPSPDDLVDDVVSDQPEGKVHAESSEYRIAAPDLALIRKLVDRQLGFLCDFKSLAQALHDRPRPDPWRLDEIVPLEIGESLIAVVDASTHRYRFRLDNAATPIGSPAAALAPAEERATDLLALFDAFDALLTFAGLTLDALVIAGYMPATLTSENIAAARKLVAGDDRSAELIERAAQTGELLRLALAMRGQMLTQVLVALEKYRVYVDPAKRSSAEILLSFARYFPTTASGSDAAPRGMVELIKDSLAGSFLGLALSTPTGLTAFKTALVKERAARRSVMIRQLGDDQTAALWERWRERLLAWIEQGTSQIAEIEEDELITAVQGVPPGSLFRIDLATMTPLDWSAVVTEGLAVANAKSAVPVWLTFVGLYALGFDAGALDTMAKTYASNFSDRPPLDMVTIGRLVAKAPSSAPRGLLLLARGDGAPILGSELGGQPVIVVAQGGFERYSAGIEWLVAAGVIEGRADESE